MGGRLSFAPRLSAIRYSSTQEPEEPEVCIGCPGRNVKFRESRLAHRYCKGEGIEIGAAAHNPFGLDTINVDMNDGVAETPYTQEQMRLCGSVAKVDVVAPGDSLPFEDCSYDFVVSSHVLEHFSNPIGALLEWDRVIRPGGVIFAIVPHKERTADSTRERTTLEHLIDDFRNPPAYEAGDAYSHQHVWVAEDMVELVEWMQRECPVSWRLLAVRDVDDKVGNGFTIVIRKTDPDRPTSLAQRAIGALRVR
jgi:SAM-dependent methyltransferase